MATATLELLHIVLHYCTITVLYFFFIIKKWVSVPITDSAWSAKPFVQSCVATPLPVHFLSGSGMVQGSGYARLTCIGQKLNKNCTKSRTKYQTQHDNLLMHTEWRRLIKGLATRDYSETSRTSPQRGHGYLHGGHDMWKVPKKATASLY